MNDLMSTMAAAEFWRISKRHAVNRFRQIAKAGKAKMIEGRWFAEREAVETFTPLPRGNPTWGERCAISWRTEGVR